MMLLCCWLFLLFAIQSAAVPSGFVAEGIADLDVTKAAFAPNPRLDGKPMLFLSAKTGEIYVLENPDSSDTSLQVANMASLLCTNGPHGLYTILPDPNFSRNQYIYMYYSRYVRNCPDDPVLGPRNRVSRFTMNRTTLQIDLTSEVLFFETLPSPEFLHDGGAMLIGNDNRLYVAIGDGGANDFAQDKRNLYGKLLRFNLDGTVPSSNPYTAASGQQGVPCRKGEPESTASTTAVCEEIWAVGLRNPFRMGLDMNSARVRFAIADVGGSFWEEISLGGDAYKEANYGWTKYEGPCKKDSTTNCPLQGANFTEPFFYYPHVGGAAVTGVVFVPNGVWPAQYKMLYTDYVDGKLYNLVEDPGRACRTCKPPVPAYRNDFFHQADSLVDLLFGPYMNTQALYYVQRSGSGQKIRRIHYTGSTNRAPVAVISLSKTRFARSETVPFQGDASSDPDGDSLTFLWDFGDGRTSTLINPQIRYSDNGQYDITLTVTDSLDQTSQDQITIVVGNAPPSVVMNSPIEKDGFYVGQKLRLKGTAKDSNGDLIPASKMFWEVQIKHDTHFHPFLEEVAGNDFDLFPAPKPEDLLATRNSFLVVSLTAYDQFNISTTKTRNILPKLVNLDLATVPSGLKLVVDDTVVTTPITITSWQAHNLTLVANDQGANHFASWSLGGGRTTSYIVPPAMKPNPKITATFADAAPVPASFPVTAPAPVPVRIPVKVPVRTPIPVQVPVPARPPIKLPVPVPVKAPVPAPVKMPLAAPVLVPIIKAPIKAPVPIPVPVTAPAHAPVKIPVKAPVRIPIPVQLPVPAPLPVKRPVPAPVKSPVPAPVKMPLTAPVLVPIIKAPIKAPVPIPVPVTAPAHAPVKIPVKVPVHVPIPVQVPVPAPLPLKLPVPVPGKAPVPAPVKMPLTAPVLVPIIKAPVPIPVPVTAPAHLPVNIPVTLPIQVKAPVPVKVPVKIPVTAPVPIPIIKAPIKAPVPVTAPAHAPVKIPVKTPVRIPIPKLPVPVPGKAPVPAPVKMPLTAPVHIPIIKAPIKAPVPIPVTAPASVPVKVPVPVPVQRPVLTPSLVRINEIHYSNHGRDVGEFVEISSPISTPVAAYSVWLYDGESGRTYSRPIRLKNITPTTVAGVNYYVLVFPNVLQNHKDGIALVVGRNRTVSFLSYEGIFAATNGPASGLTSIDIGVADGSSPVGTSVQLCPDTGIWSGPKDDTRGQPNANCNA